MNRYLFLTLLLGFGSCSSPSQLGKSVAYSGRNEQLTPSQVVLDMQRAENGDSLAAQRLGRHYFDDKQPAKGFDWLRRASMMGNHAAQHDFFVNSSGAWPGVPNTAEARMWLEKACRGGYGPAIASRNAEKKYKPGGVIVVEPTTARHM